MRRQPQRGFSRETKDECDGWIGIERGGRDPITTSLVDSADGKRPADV
jgi:hypothetical protein